jgi:glycosyltransferase involved in cell wall biosynthesis
MKAKLSTVIITSNEASNIKACIQSVKFCDQVIVVDSDSNDDTTAIAESCGAIVSHRDFDNYADQKNYAVSLAQSDWVLSIDADERITPELQTSILKSIGLTGDANVYSMQRLNILFGQKQRYGGNQNDWPIRLFKKSSGRFNGQIHETWQTSESIGKLEGVLMHHSTPNIKAYMHKLNLYTDLELAQTKSRQSIGSFDLWLKPFIRFWQRYVWQLGLLDGRSGFVAAFTSAYYEFVRSAKLWRRN